MALVTVARYKAITGDATLDDAEIASLLADATERLEDALDRKLESAERTERMFPTRDGSLWPHAVPITDGGTYTVDGNRLVGAWHSWPSLVEPAHGLDVTYTGGYVERTADAEATNRLPICMEEDIAIAAYLLGHPQPLAAQAAVPAGAISASLGDASINYGPKGAPTARTSRITWSSATVRYRYIRIGGEPC